MKECVKGMGPRAVSDTGGGCREHGRTRGSVEKVNDQLFGGRQVEGRGEGVERRVMGEEV